MKKEITEEIITKAMGYLNNTEAFLKAEIPLYLQEIVKYHLYAGSLYLLISVVWLFSFAIACRKMTKADNEGDRKSLFHSNNLGVPVGLLGAVGSIVSVVTLLCWTGTVVKAAVAPRMFLLEYFSNLVK